MTISVRLVLSSAIAVLFMLTFSPQLTTDITIWRLVSSSLRPPYLYLLLNFIILTIFASSKLHHYEGEEDHSKLADIMQPRSLTEIQYENVSHELYPNENHVAPMPKTTLLATNLQLVASNNADISYSHDGTKDTANFETSKLPGSASFLKHKLVEPHAQGKRKLGVPKAEQELETLESTWKAITDCRPMPINHLQTGGGKLQNSHNMITSETFNQQLGSNRNKLSRTLGGSSSSGKLKKDPSPGQDELNKRVEAFISRFKEDMRLQRKESLRQYVEMINSGAY